MPQGFQPYFDRQALLFMEGEMDVLAQDYVLPFHMIAMKRVARFETRKELTETLMKTRAFLLKNGVTELRPEVVALGLTRNHRRSIWVNWFMTGPKLERSNPNKVQYIVVRHGPAGPIQSEVMEYSEMIFPQMSELMPLL